MYNNLKIKKMNKVELMGRLGFDPEMLNDGKIARFSLATGRVFTKNEKTIDTTQWHNIVCFDKIAGLAEKYLKKGDAVLINGRLDYKTYQDKDGIKRTATNIVVERLFLLNNNRKKNTPDTQQTVEEPFVFSNTEDDLPF